MKTETRNPEAKTNDHPRRPAAFMIAGTVAVLMLSGCTGGGSNNGSPFEMASVLDEGEMPAGLHECESADVDTEADVDDPEGEDMWTDRPEPSYFGIQTLAPSSQGSCESNDFYMVLMEMRFDDRSDYEEWRECIEATWDSSSEDEIDDCDYTHGLWGGERIFLVFAAPTDTANPNSADREAMEQATDDTADALMAKYPGLESNLDERTQYS